MTRRIDRLLQLQGTVSDLYKIRQALAPLKPDVTDAEASKLWCHWSDWEFGTPWADVVDPRLPLFVKWLDEDAW